MLDEHGEDAILTTSVTCLAFSNFRVSDVLDAGNSGLGCLFQTLDTCLRQSVKRRHTAVNAVYSCKNSFERQRGNAKKKSSS